MTYRWFGTSTSRWKVVPLREVAQLGTGHTPSREVEQYWVDCKIPWVTVEDIRDHGDGALNPIFVTKQHISELGLANSAAVLHPKGTVMLSRTASIGFTCIIGVPMATTQAFVTWTPNKTVLDGNFLHAVLKAMGQQFEYLAYGATHLTIYFTDIKTLRIPLPPLPEQIRIAAFLARETSKIDSLIAEQRRLVDLLKEKRQTVISHAVTRGLNPDAAMKPSGIEWLGDVPTHWKVRKLNAIARLESGHTPSRQRPDYWIEADCVIPWFTLADVGFLRHDCNIFIKSTTQRISQVGIANSSARLLPPDTVILSRTASVGFSGITKIDLAVSQDFAAWICGIDLHPLYLLFCLRAMKPEFQRIMMGSTHQTIYMPDIEAFRIPLPPVPEQLAIAEFVQNETGKFDTLTIEAQHTIDLLQERRTALIFAAVTGQTAVRNTVAPT